MEALASRSNWNLEVLVFVEGGKPEIPEKNPRSKARTKDKLNPHETASTGIELGSQRWDQPPTVLPVLILSNQNQGILLSILSLLYASETGGYIFNLMRD